jgi:hypothetical protein
MYYQSFFNTLHNLFYQAFCLYSRSFRLVLTCNVTNMYRTGGHILTTWGLKNLGPLEKLREIVDYVFCQHTKHNITNQRYIGILCIQGGSDISGTLSKLHYSLKKSSFLLILSRQNISAVCQAISKNKQTHSGKDELTGSSKSRDCLRTSRRTDWKGDYELQISI